MLILPGSIEFTETLNNSLNYWISNVGFDGTKNYCTDHETGLVKVLDKKQTIEYLYGGEYDLVDDLDNGN